MTELDPTTFRAETKALHAGQIDARDERADPGDLAVGDGGEAVLEVDARPLDPDLDLARREVCGSKFADAAFESAVVVALGDKGTERRRDGGHVANGTSGAAWCARWLRHATGRGLTPCGTQGCVSTAGVDESDVRPSAFGRHEKQFPPVNVYAQAAPPYGGWV